MSEAGGSRTGAQAVERAAHVLRLFDSPQASLSITELAEGSGLSVSTVHRLVTALRTGGLLDQDTRTDRYRLGGLIVALGRRADQALGIPRLVPTLQEIATRTGESVNLGMRSGDEMVVLHHIPSTHALRFDQVPGRRVPIYASAMGKAVLALDEPLSDAVAALGVWDSMTEHTRSPAELVAELEQIRIRGWGLNNEERELGVRAVGIALPPTAGVPGGGIAVQGPSVRMSDERIQEIGALLLEIVAGL
ncbi:MAG: Transcriptional regulator, IclR family [Frankiales bacterium]|nr:Transcriptional regulator, IclR family [Frankiales bacterium]